MLTRVGVLITLIDDIYDVYGTLDELEVFGNVLERWEINDMDQLPDYMKICFLATYNAVNEMGYDVLKEQGLLIIKYLKNLVELKRGDNPKSIQCDMHESGVSEEEARQHIKFLISETLKLMNEDRVAKSLFPQAFVESTMNVIRMAMSMYQKGDVFGVYQERDPKETVLSIIVNPIPI
ncbi:hypothetical protein TIFTF001_047980 [Ficus carica]|uniref:Terpene synthase metal-binding domain-containing protein n=1 Tax=Ficus carica TaxID=3494 RepID=A0AA88CSM5_FICCA|nr:hypothetical protein TIFTF001_047980 [Ficus carica]